MCWKEKVKTKKRLMMMRGKLLMLPFINDDEDQRLGMGEGRK
jgi:hypothetical protein